MPTGRLSIGPACALALLPACVKGGPEPAAVPQHAPPRATSTERPVDEGFVVPEGADVAWVVHAEEGAPSLPQNAQLLLRSGEPMLRAGDLFLPVAGPGSTSAEPPFVVPGARGIADAAFTLGGALLLVIGSDLGVAGPEGFIRLVELPAPGMRIAAASRDEVFVFGGGKVLLLRRDGALLDLARLPEADSSGARIGVTAVAGTPERILVAWGSSLLVFEPGESPTVLFDAGEDIVIESLASVAGGVFVSTSSGVGFVSDDGLAVVPVLRGKSAEMLVEGGVLYAWIEGEGLLRFPSASAYAALATRPRSPAGDAR